MAGDIAADLLAQLYVILDRAGQQVLIAGDRHALEYLDDGGARHSGGLARARRRLGAWLGLLGQLVGQRQRALGRRRLGLYGDLLGLDRDGGLAGARWCGYLLETLGHALQAVHQLLKVLLAVVVLAACGQIYWVIFRGFGFFGSWAWSAVFIRDSSSSLKFLRHRGVLY